MDYSTGFTYTASGNNVQPSGGIAPSQINSSSQTLNGVNSTWTGLDLTTGSRPTWTQTTPGAAFSFVESYTGPGLQNHTVIQRSTEIKSVTDTTSVFTQ